MYLRYASSKLLVNVYQYAKENNGVTIRQVKNHLNICKQHAHQALTALRVEGYLSYTGKQGATPTQYFVTDKPFDINNVKPFRKPRQKPKTKQCATPTLEIEIKPDLAAMWLVKSKPHSVKRSIPIVRSIGLGVRQSTSLR